MPTPSTAGVIALDLRFRPQELLDAWRPEGRRLVVLVREQVLKRQRVQAHISVATLRAAATITGRATAVRRQPDGYEVELEPDDTRLRALQRLVEAAAAGEPTTYQPRAPRLLAAVPAVISGPCGPTYMKTFAVSENGCGLAWTGPIPDLGAPLEIRLGAGSQVASFCGEVCWTEPSGRAPTVGIQFAAGNRALWSRMIADLKRSGAPPA
jgi:hypothetical protein